MHEARHLETVGRLAGVTAHDFNNLLTIIAGHGHLLLREGSLEGVTQAFVQEIVKAGDRAALLTHQLEALSPCVVHQPMIVDLNVLVARLEKILCRLTGDTIAVHIVLGEAPAWVEIDPRQIERAMLNLAINARAAMSDGGQFEVTTHADDGYARLTVSATGWGLDGEMASRLCDPSYALTDPGQGGNRLEFATLRGIVERNGGELHGESEPGQGTTIRITFPLHQKMHATQFPAELPRGHETLLLVEDDVQVRTVMRRTLESAGYWVLEAADEAEALDLGQRHQGPIHLLVTDVVMPLLNGPELAERLLAQRPDLRVLFVSGHAAEDLHAYGVPGRSGFFLQKPFAPHRLAQCVRDILHELV